MLVTFYQEGISLELELLISTNNENKVLGTLFDELFAWIDLQKTLGADGLKLSKPLNIKLQDGGKFDFNTGLADKRLTQKLKLNSTPKGKRRYAKKVVHLIKYMKRTQTLKSLDSVLESLEA